MAHREETTWVVRLEVGAEFADDYDGDLDGYAWRERWQREVQPRLLAALVRELQASPGWRARSGNHGLPARDEVVFNVELDPDSEAFAPRS
jgi:hypothetical protein